MTRLPLGAKTRIKIALLTFTSEVRSKLYTITQIIYEQYRFKNKNKERGKTVPQPINCSHDFITPDEILRDRLVVCIRDDHVHERLRFNISRYSRHHLIGETVNTEQKKTRQQDGFESKQPRKGSKDKTA